MKEERRRRKMKRKDLKSLREKSAIKKTKVH
jgi:hypothetical protein